MSITHELVVDELIREEKDDGYTVVIKATARYGAVALRFWQNEADAPRIGDKIRVVITCGGDE